MTHDAHEGFGRRGALTALLGTAAVVTASSAAQAAASASNVQKFGSAASPITATIASPALASYVYRTLTYQDFLPLDPSSSARTFGGSGGVYGASVLEATQEIPAGAILREIEWYVANTSGSNVTLYCALWTPADGYINLFAPTTAPTGSGLQAVKTTLTSANWGPYPDGAKLYLYAPTSSTVLLNGVRLAFSNGGLEAAIRSAPLKVYDSGVTGGKYTANQKRNITLDAVATGTTAVILRVITYASTTNGSVKVWPLNLAEPDIGSANILANSESIAEITVAMNTARLISIKPSRAVHVRLDLVGVLR